MAIFPYLRPTAVTARVRLDSVLSTFVERTFDLMLDEREPQDKQLSEAGRILAQLGYETRLVRFAPSSSN